MRMIRRSLTLILALTLLVGMLPAVPLRAEENTTLESVETEENATSENDAPAENGTLENSAPAMSFSLMSAAPEPFPATASYLFYLKEGDAAPWNEQHVKDGESLVDPGVPADPDGIGSFAGWYPEGSDEPFREFGEITGIDADREVRLYARFTGSVLVRYADAEGNILYSHTAMPGEEILVRDDFPEVKPISVTAKHIGWALTQGSTEDVTGSFTVGDEDLTFYPIFKEGYWVHFESNGGSAYRSQFIPLDAADKRAQDPGAPTRFGYRFTGWCADPELTTDYDFRQEVTGTRTIYARYETMPVKYTVMYYIDRQTSIEPKGEMGGTWKVHLIATEVRTGEVGDPAEFDPTLIFKEPYSLQAAGYELDPGRTRETLIEAGHETVYRVYYRPRTFRLQFVGLPHRNGGTFDIDITDRYSADLTYMWEMMAEGNDLDVLFDGRHMIEIWTPSGSGVDKIQSAYDPAFMKVPSHDLIDGEYKERGSFNYHGRYFKETLEGEAPGGAPVYSNTSARVLTNTVQDDRTYYLFREQSFNGGGYAIFSELEAQEATGFTLAWQLSDGNTGQYQAGDDIRWGFWLVHFTDRMYALDNQRNGTPRYNYNHSYLPSGWQASDYWFEDEHDGYLDIYYTRNQYTLDFHENLPEGVDPSYLLEDQEVYYEKDLAGYQPANYVVGETTVTDVSGTPYVFRGWYNQEIYTDTTLFQFQETMPAHDVNLFARWELPVYTIQLDLGDGEITELEVRHGERIPRPEDPVNEGKLFLGWTESGAPYSFESPVTGPLVLKAEWREVDVYSVTYDLNGGQGQPPTDENRYHPGALIRICEPEDVTAPEGQVFLGWAVDGGDTLVYPGGILEMPAQNVALVAQWGEASRTTKLTYDYNFERFDIRDAAGGENSRTVDQIVNNQRVELADFESLRPLPEGYAFTGWYLDPQCTDGPHTRLQVDRVDEDKNVVYAGWKPDGSTITYTVEFYYAAKGKYPEKPTSTETRRGQLGQEVLATDGDRQPDRKGYLFDADAPNVLSVQLVRDTAAVLKLYFKQEQYDLSFDPNGGTINGSSAPLVIRAGFGDTVIIPAAPVRSGYTFDYWKGSVYRPGDKYVVEGTHRFTAQWKQSSGGGTDPGDTPAQPDPGKDAAEPTRPAAPAAGDGAAPVAPTVQPAVDGGTPPTGDASRTVLWTALMLLAAAVAAAGLIRQRGQKR